MVERVSYTHLVRVRFPLGLPRQMAPNSVGLEASLQFCEVGVFFGSVGDVL